VARDHEACDYDYLEEPPRHFGDIFEDLNRMGREGWEAFAAFSVGGSAMPNVVVLVKRRVD